MTQSMNPPTHANNTQRAATNPLLLILAWTVVLLPTIWGVSYTIQNAMKIFTAPASTSAPAPASSSAPASPAIKP